MSDILMHLTYDKLHPAEDNVRTTLGDVTELKHSIVKIGLIQPIRIQENADGYTILAGARRHAAIGAAIDEGLLKKNYEIACVISDKGFASDPERAVIMLVENVHRAGITPLEEALTFGRLANVHGWSVEDIATHTSFPASTVKQRLSWLKLPDHIFTQIGGKVDLGVATSLATCSADVIADLTSNKKVPDQWKIDQAKRQRGLVADEKRIRNRLTKAGHIVLSADDVKWVLSEEGRTAIAKKDSSMQPVHQLLTKLEKWEAKDTDHREVKLLNIWNHDAKALDERIAELPVPSLFSLELRNSLFLRVFEATEWTDEEIEDGDDQTDDEEDPALAEAQARYDEAVEVWVQEMRAIRTNFIADKTPAHVAYLLQRQLRTYDYTLKHTPQIQQMLGLEADVDLVEWASQKLANMAQVLVAAGLYANPDSVPGALPQPDWAEFAPPEPQQELAEGEAEAIAQVQAEAAAAEAEAEARED